MTLTEEEIKKINKIHLQICFAAFSRMESICGENMGYVEIDGKIRHVYGGAIRTSNPNKANCTVCIKIKNIIEQERQKP